MLCCQMTYHRILTFWRDFHVLRGCLGTNPRVGGSVQCCSMLIHNSHGPVALLSKMGYSMQHTLTKSDSSNATEEVPSKYDLLNYTTSGKSLHCQETDSSNITKSGPTVNPLNNRVMLFDGTAIMYRSYYKLLAKLHHGLLGHADGNGDWVLTIFTALSLKDLRSNSSLPHNVASRPCMTCVVPSSSANADLDCGHRRRAHLLEKSSFATSSPSNSSCNFLQQKQRAWSSFAASFPSNSTTAVALLDALEFVPSHVAVVFDHDGMCSSENACSVITFHKCFWRFPFGQSSCMPSQEPYMGKGEISSEHSCDSVDFYVLFFYASDYNIIFEGITFRHMIYPSYKSNRIPTPDTVIQALQYFKASIKAMSIKVIEVPGVEADDVVGTLAVNSVSAGYKVRIVSPDKDFFQVLSPSLRILRLASRGSGMVSFGLEDFAKRYGDLKPSQFVDIAALAGDKSDNIPGTDTIGVEGIGEINALKLITKFGSLENLLDCVDQVEDERIKQALMTNADLARLCKNLATLRSDLPSYMVPFETPNLVFRKPQDGGEKFIGLLRAIGAYAEGFSADPIIRRTSYLWNRLRT
ncbi:hypothetical protein ZIOFF_014638 [Zingiber officinale]|uniref:5'-3' exonuclease domain-containing protein n=1 Tax=Zingiber officinale TaxID=94328 RepID=A0A8J5HWP1_ZINOF|nr:hypothetical protein ZIOFF_014638 [Zingiber officinale]